MRPVGAPQPQRQVGAALIQQVTSKNIIFSSAFLFMIMIFHFRWGTEFESWMSGGACGYNIIDADKKYAAALSEVLFNEGQSCGQCYKITCNSQSGSKFCRNGSTVTVMATSFFPPERASLSDSSDTKLENEHFHLSQCAWKEISLDESKVVPVLYQRWEPFSFLLISPAIGPK